jgi:hypothetical protein
VNGTSWDFEASIQVIVRRFDGVEAYLAQHGRAHLGRADLVAWRRTSVQGLPAVKAILARPRGTREELTFLETGDGRVVIVIGECPAGLHAAFAPWFDAVLGSLEIVRAKEPPRDRDYRPRLPPTAGEPTPR